ncbi:hypothetical protein M378DRAFT_115016 [Amanita muscaria Koide BX008]|uniref:DUF6593 domain-containing protein n=1 Tax=Amanita muscaria (strain Koide BX008) TaxID=946122 RepID=A0A0C2XR21_AMAMK|nr:hypothetical protein M378DRAFT_115016 [Amanita muscaria Koide BX008]
MIILSPTEKEDGEPHNSSTSSFPPPPPSHPAIQYGSTTITSPPRYAQTRRPTTNITYSFVQDQDIPNSMILKPPPYFEGHFAPYWIGVNMNCFTPSSYITTIKRGARDGDLVGDFELGIATMKKPTVCIRGNEYLLNDVVEANHKLFRNSWVYKLPEKERSITLCWDEESNNGTKSCFLSSKDRTVANLLAKFLVPTHPRKQGRPQEHTRLEITPHGYDFLDDIIMSVLVLERLRTTPSVVDILSKTLHLPSPRNKRAFLI